jgi:hypothetical protein
VTGDAGILYDSLHHAGGSCVVAYRPGNIRDVTQVGHYDIAVQVAVNLIDVRKLTV